MNEQEPTPESGPCSRCGATIGEPCVIATGKNKGGPRGGYHHARTRPLRSRRARAHRAAGVECERVEAERLANMTDGERIVAALAELTAEVRGLREDVARESTSLSRLVVIAGRVASGDNSYSASADETREWADVWVQAARKT